MKIGLQGMIGRNLINLNGWVGIFSKNLDIYILRYIPITSVYILIFKYHDQLDQE